MDAIVALKKHWEDEARFRPFYPYVHVSDAGLLLGASTKLAHMARDRRGNQFLQLDGEEERILALLSLAYKTRISVEAIKFIKRASMQWAKGEKALAHFELAYARLPRFEAKRDAWPLFYADFLAKRGLSPRS